MVVRTWPSQIPLCTHPSAQPRSNHHQSATWLCGPSSSSARWCDNKRLYSKRKARASARFDYGLEVLLSTSHSIALCGHPTDFLRQMLFYSIRTIPFKHHNKAIISHKAKGVHTHTQSSRTKCHLESKMRCDRGGDAAALLRNVRNKWSNRSAVRARDRG